MGILVGFGDPSCCPHRDVSRWRQYNPAILLGSLFISYASDDQAVALPGNQVADDQTLDTPIRVITDGPATLVKK